MPTPNDSAVFLSLRRFIASCCPGIEIVQGQDNRVPEPKANDFVTMTPIRKPRLATNIHNPIEVHVVGFTTDTQMIAAEVEGQIFIGMPIIGSDVLPGTVVTSFITGDGGPGAYGINFAQTVPDLDFYYGFDSIVQFTEMVIQIDVHGPSSGDNAQIISTLFRDAYCCDFMAADGGVCAPLFCDDPIQMPFSNEGMQTENRWVIDLHLEVQPAISVPQQFAGAAEIKIINVGVAYPL